MFDLHRLPVDTHSGVCRLPRRQRGPWPQNFDRVGSPLCVCYDTTAPLIYAYMWRVEWCEKECFQYNDIFKIISESCLNHLNEVIIKIAPRIHFNFFCSPTFIAAPKWPPLALLETPLCIHRHSIENNA